REIAPLVDGFHHGRSGVEVGPFLAGEVLAGDGGEVDAEAKHRTARDRSGDVSSVLRAHEDLDRHVFSVVVLVEDAATIRRVEGDPAAPCPEGRDRDRSTEVARPLLDETSPDTAVPEFPRAVRVH